MQTSTRGKSFTGTSQALQEQLEAFRIKHPVKYLTVNGVTCDYLVGGTGEETFVLLTGGTNSNELLFQIISAFESHYRVIAPRYPSVRTMAEVIDWLLAMLDAEGVQQAHVLGESYGGMVAQCLVRRAPSRVSSLILVSTLAPIKPLPLRPKLQKLLVMLLPWHLFVPLSRRLMVPVLARTPFPEEERAFWTATVIEQIGCVSKDWLINSYRNSEDYSEHYHFTPQDLAHWPGTVLILGSDADEALQRYRPHAIPLTTLYPQAQVHLFHGAGHVPPLTRREEYIEVLQRFLAQRPSAIGARGSETSPAVS
jgi:pimeloyl-ACP methyl ester carboxylesterase